MQAQFPGLDRFDQSILRELSHNGRISVSELAQVIGLSKSPTQARLKRLETEGYIQGYRALVDPIRLGLDHVAFVEVKLTDTREAALAAFNAAVVLVEEIEEVHMLASHFDYLLKVRCRSMSDYRAILGEKISSLPHVSSTSTYMSMQAVKDDAGLAPM
ncbi:Lrp/AsnC family transcriptional regulator [Arenibacterium sp. LLYu02]|uniref:Lrp/AsnC family transcriptional regulator n=1 Tax=Arenibacterium sp. LLYu02 TaxID=3404132 RepID=UPI003B20F506